MRRLLLRSALGAKRPLIIHHYDEFTSSRSSDQLAVRGAQDKALAALVRHSVETVPYYRDLFRTIGLTPADVQTVADLAKLPILTKAEIKADPSRLVSTVPGRFVMDSTGGSTGVPLKYRVSVDCYSRGVALLFRGWGFAGYQLGDSMATIAGASLVSTTQPTIAKLRDYFLNVRHYSSYGMSEEMLAAYFADISSWRPEFLRGYASSLYLFAKFVEESRKTIGWPLKAVFSTAEVLTDGQRAVIERALGAKVFNNYGLNDGGVSAYECTYHDGFHVDLERSVLEIVNENGSERSSGPGKILATSLYNYAMPFIRYETGDIASWISAGEPCPCGCWRPRITNILGRTTDFLTLNGRLIGSPQLTVLMGKVDLEQYQLIQTGRSSLRVRYRPGRTFSPSDKNYIASSFEVHVGPIRVEFEEMGPLEADNKHKFIINASTSPES